MIRPHHRVRNRLHFVGVTADETLGGIEAPCHHGAAENHITFFHDARIRHDFEKVVLLQLRHHRIKVCKCIDLTGTDRSHGRRRRAHPDEGYVRGLHAALGEHEVRENLRA